MSDTGMAFMNTNGVTAPTHYPLYAEIGTTGTPIFAGRVSDEILPILFGDKARALYREMSDNDPTIGSFLYGIEQQIRGTDFTWEPAEGDRSAEFADHFNSCFEDMNMSWADTLSGLMSHLPYGWAFNETVYKRRLGPDQKDPSRRSKFDDGRIGWRKWALRNQSTRLRWAVDDEGGVQGIWQLAPPRYVTRFIPIERGLLFRTTAAGGNPEGRSLLRNAVEPYLYAKHLRRIEGIGAERDLAGYPVIEAPAEWFGENAADDQKRAIALFLQLVTQIRRDSAEGTVMPVAYDAHGNKLIDLKLLSTGGTRQIELDPVIARYEQRMAMTVLADFILLGHEQVGSYNLGASKIDLWAASIQARCNAIADVASSHAAPRLMGLNGWPKEKTPRLIPGRVARPDMAALGTFIQALAASGAQLWSGDPEHDQLRRAIMRWFGLPDDPPVEITTQPEPELPTAPTDDKTVAADTDGSTMPAAGETARPLATAGAGTNGNGSRA